MIDVWRFWWQWWELHWHTHTTSHGHSQTLTERGRRKEGVGRQVGEGEREREGIVGTSVRSVEVSFSQFLLTSLCLSSSTLLSQSKIPFLPLSSLLFAPPFTLISSFFFHRLYGTFSLKDAIIPFSFYLFFIFLSHDFFLPNRSSFQLQVFSSSTTKTCYFYCFFFFLSLSCIFIHSPRSFIISSMEN